MAHVLGQAELLATDKTLELLQQQVAIYEPEPAAAMAKMPWHYQQQLAAGIVGVRVSITQLAGKLKLGQQRSQADQQGVYQALQGSSSPQASALASLMKQLQLGIG